MKKITLIGGDSRLLYLKERLLKEGFSADSIGLCENDCGDISSSDIIILPIPTTKDKINVFSPLCEKEIPLKSVEEKINQNQLVLLCNYCFEEKNCIDYGALDSYALLNAVPTAEGAIKIAIENTPYTVWKSNVLVIGYGRVGKVLADRLKALGANVTVSARKASDFSLLDTLGFKHINTGQLNSIPIKFDMIFNTVDVKVLNNETLKKSECDLIIDLSTFGGFDMSAALKSGIKAIKAPGLPVKIAPDTAGQILCDTLIPIINSYSER